MLKNKKHNNMKKILMIALLCMAQITWVAGIPKDNGITGGICGNDLTWQLEGSGVLTIEGTGAMYDYALNTDSRAPWYDYVTSFTAIILPEGMTHIGNYAFYNSSSTESPNIVSITIPSTVTSIGQRAFYEHRHLAELTIPEGVSSIGESAFNGCVALGTLTLPSTLNNLGDYAFAYCSALNIIWCHVRTPLPINSVFEYTNKESSCTLYVPYSSREAYAAAVEWRDFHAIQPIPGTEPINGTVGDLSYTFYRDGDDDGLLAISGDDRMPESAFMDEDFRTAVKRIAFDEQSTIYYFGKMWFPCYVDSSQLQTVDIYTSVPLNCDESAIYYKQDEPVTFTINAPSIGRLKGVPFHGSPLNIIFNIPAQTVFEQRWFSSLESTDRVTIPSGSLCRIPEAYVFVDSYTQAEYDYYVSMGEEDEFWTTHPTLVEGVDYTRTEETTEVLTAANASIAFGDANVTFQEPTVVSTTTWIHWTEEDLETFPEMSNDSSHVCKDMTLHIDYGQFEKSDIYGLHLVSNTLDGVRFVAPTGKTIKRILIINKQGPFSDPEWTIIKEDVKEWSGSAAEVGFDGELQDISYIGFELEGNEPTGVESEELGGKSEKFIRDGQLFIERNGHIYNAQGVQVK